MTGHSIVAQLFLFLAVLAIGVGILVVRGRTGARSWILVGALLVGSAAAVLAFQTRQTDRIESISSLVEATPDRLHRRAALDVGAARDAPLDSGSDPLGDYVSSDRCQACHPGNHASWHDSFHRTMTQEASPESVLGRFEGQTLVARGRSYKLERRDDEYWVEMADPDWERDLLDRGRRPDDVASPPLRWKRIVMTTGSHHMQTYWVASERDGRLFNFPWLWLNEDARWIPREEGFIRPPGGGRTYDIWHDSCIECHAVAGEKDRAANGAWNPRVAELGIACEACHGPADEHVRANHDPARRYRFRMNDEPDPTIVNPARLDAEAAAQVCGHCHGINLVKARPLRDGQRYRPGDDLRETRIILRATNTTPAAERQADWARMKRHIEKKLAGTPSFLEDRFWPDGMVRVSGREHNGLIESACFEGGELSCLSCHSMHDSDPNDQLARDRQGNAACLQCHASFAEDLASHTHHAPESLGSRCQNCHMPHTVYGLLKSIRSHWIDSPCAATTVATGRPNACNLCHLDRSLGWSADHLSSWYGQPRPALSEDEESVAEGVRWLLTGHAQQRAMIAWHMGWPEARAAAGEEWMGLFLGHLLDDPYPAVRYVAGRSLAQLPSSSTFEYDFLAPDGDRAEARRSAMDAGRAALEAASGSALPELLIRRDGRVDEEELERLARLRDDRRMDLRE